MAEHETDAKLTLLQFLGNELRRQRERSGLTLRDLSRKTTFDHSYFSRVERATQIPSENVARTLDDLFQTGGTFGELVEVVNGGTVQDYQRRGAEREMKAEWIRVFTSSDVPALLQTEDYARARIASRHPKTPARSFDAAVAARMARQRVLTREAPPPYRALMDEAVLRRPVGGKRVMADQLSCLLQATENLDVGLRVVPFDRGNYWMLGGSLTLLTQPHGPTLAYIESFGSGELVESTRRVIELAQQFHDTHDIAASEQESLAMISAYLEEYRE